MTNDQRADCAHAHACSCALCVSVTAKFPASYGFGYISEQDEYPAERIQVMVSIESEGITILQSKNSCSTNSKLCD